MGGPRGTQPAEPAAELVSWLSVQSLDDVSTLQPGLAPSPPPSRIGPYVIHRVVGVGGMGVVYEAEPGGGGPRVAVKTLSGMSPRTLYRFKQEFRRTASLIHPNLVALYELGADDASWYFSMDLVSGAHFLAECWQSASFPGGQVASAGVSKVLPPLLDALSFLHENEILHLDIKPGNIAFTRQGELKLLDFGLSQAAHWGHEQRGGFCGTPAYMAPEQVLGECSAASDCYALGVTLFHATTGLLPHVGTPRSTLLSKRNPVAPVRAVEPGIPIALGRVIDGLLHPDPSERMTLAEARELLGWRRSAAAIRSSPPQQLYGRSRESGLLRGLLARVEERSILCRVSGDSGVGKTALLGAVSLSWERSDTVLLRSRCFQWQAIAFKAVDEIVDQLLFHARDLLEQGRELPADLPLAQAMFPVLGELPFDVIPQRPRDPLAEKERGLRALGELVGMLARERIVVLCIDDAHWGDAESAELLESVIAECPRRLLLVLCDRPTESKGLVARITELATHYAQLDIRLGPLEAKDAESLARAIAGTKYLAQAEIERLVADTGGLPLLIERVARFSGPDHPIPLSEVVRRQLADFSEERRRLAITAMLSSSPTALDALATACDLSGSHIALSSLQAARLLRSHGALEETMVEPYHDRLRAAVLSCVDPAFVRTQSARLAQALDVRGATPGQSAELWAAAGHPERAAERARDAARQAARVLAFPLAVELFERAFSWAAEASDGAALEEARASGGSSAQLLGDAAVLQEYAWALYRSGNCIRAAEVFARAATLVDGELRFSLLSCAVEAHFVSGQVNQGMALLDTLLDEVRIPKLKSAPLILGQLVRLILAVRRRLGRRPTRAFDQRARLRAQLCWDSGKVLITLSSAEGAVLLLQSLAYAMDSGDELLIARGLALAGSGFLPFFDDKRAVILPLLENIAQSQGDAYLPGLVHLTHAVTAHMDGRWSEALEHLDAAENDFTRCTQVTNFETGLIVTSRMVALSQLGRFSELEEFCRRTRRGAELRGDLVSYASALCNRIFCHLVRGEEKEVAAGLDRYQRLIDSWSAGYGMWHSASWLLRLADQLRRGGSDQATAEMRVHWRKVKAASLLHTRAARVDLLEGRATVLLAVPPEEGRTLPLRKRRELARIARLLTRTPRSDAAPYAAVLRAALAFDKAEYSVAFSELRQAAELYEAAQMAERACLVRWQLAVLHEDELARLHEEEIAYGLGVRGISAWAQVRVPGFYTGTQRTL